MTAADIGHVVVPSPDPTAATTDQLYRALTALQMLLESRLDGMDRATMLIDQNMRDVPSDVVTKVLALERLHDVKFESVQKQFDERDIRAKASEDAAKVAVNAALQAQKEAAGAQNESNALSISKSETATLKQIDGIVALIASNTTGTNDKIAALNSRLDRGDGMSTGKVTNQGAWMAAIGVAVALVGLLLRFGR